MTGLLTYGKGRDKKKTHDFGAGYTPVPEGEIRNIQSWPLVDDPSGSMNMVGHAPIAQLDRVTDYESVGRRFESCWARQKQQGS